MPQSRNRTEAGSTDTRSAEGTYDGLMGDARMAMPSQHDADRQRGEHFSRDGAPFTRWGPPFRSQDRYSNSKRSEFSVLVYRRRENQAMILGIKGGLRITRASLGPSWA